uniref:Secreted protein n=1 Tax=Globodera pallida TaxID=36090 RepID=A0A183CL38_GLOPA
MIKFSIILIVVVIKFVGNTNGLPIGDAFHAHASSLGAGISSAFEHRIDIPEKLPSFLEQLKSSLGELKMPMFDYRNGNEFVEIQIGSKLDESRQKIGETLFGIVTYFSNKCKLLNAVGEGSATTTQDLIIARELCSIGMFITLAKFVYIEIVKKLKSLKEEPSPPGFFEECAHWVNRAVRQKLGLTADEALPAHYLQKQNSFQILLSNAEFNAECFEKMFEFWSIAQIRLTAQNNSTNKKDRIQTNEIKQHLAELTPDTLKELGQNGAKSLVEMVLNSDNPYEVFGFERGGEFTEEELEQKREQLEQMVQAAHSPRQENALATILQKDDQS